jgi:hypothetical protein
MAAKKPKVARGVNLTEEHDKPVIECLVYVLRLSQKLVPQGPGFVEDEASPCRPIPLPVLSLCR